jgi:hypothetical protein
LDRFPAIASIHTLVSIRFLMDGHPTQSESPAAILRHPDPF